ncbi:hypothetical protein [Clostridium sp.]|uniref:hypothetical protein n=1 Tax=Clostridium sp. TaxID=1506 RepID=UPI001E05B8BA|nr:hypothetical protein [Clostridium sp.]MBS5307790.1 hypothetical protein [Clostridium sp.]
MANYKNLDKMYKDYIKTVTKTFTEIVPPIMTEEHKEAIMMEVYLKYDPTWYNGSIFDSMDRRYGDNGLLDEHNFKYDIDINKNSIVITLYNETKGNQYAPNNQSTIFIDEILVTGEGYSWESSDIAKSGMERDFYKVTEQLMNSDKVKNMIIKEFNKRGIIVW